MVEEKTTIKKHLENINKKNCKQAKITIYQHPTQIRKPLSTNILRVEKFNLQAKQFFPSNYYKSPVLYKQDDSHQ